MCDLNEIHPDLNAGSFVQTKDIDHLATDYFQEIFSVIKTAAFCLDHCCLVPLFSLLDFHLFSSLQKVCEALWCTTGILCCIHAGNSTVAS